VSANPRPVAAVWLRDSGASLSKKEVGCPLIRVLGRPFGSAIQVRVFQKGSRVFANSRPMAAVWLRNSGANLSKRKAVSANPRPVAVVWLRNSGANL
jgi:hypothetical protein